MASFKDDLQRVWTIRITPRVMLEVHEATEGDVNLGTICQDEFKGLVDLISDELNLATVLYTICRKQCEEKGISAPEFLDGILGDCITDATEAICEGLIDCYPTQKADLLRNFLKYLKVSRQVAETRNMELNSAIESISTEWLSTSQESSE